MYFSELLDHIFFYIIILGRDRGGRNWEYRVDKGEGKRIWVGLKEIVVLKTIFMF